MATSTISEERCKSGILGLDEILEGGFPKASCILLAGGPGSGKTNMSVQFLFQGASVHSEPGLLVTFDESPDSIKKNMQKFGWDLSKLEKDEMLQILDLSDFIYLTPEQYHKRAFGMNVPEFTFVGALSLIKENVEKIKAKRVVIDSVTSLSISESDEAKRRMNVAQLFRGLRELKCTCLLTSEISVANNQRDYSLEEYMADGVLLLQLSKSKDRLVKSIMVEKMRGISHDTQPRPYKITEKGFTVFPLDKIF